MDMSSEWLRELRSWARANSSVRELWVFGSRAQGCSRPESDVNLAVALMPSASRSSSEWSADDYDVLAEGAVGGRFSLTPDAPQNRQWIWTLVQGQYQDRGHEMTWKAARAAAMAAFAKNWRRE
jgi:predicted nucleotidyltransferase